MVTPLRGRRLVRSLAVLNATVLVLALVALGTSGSPATSGRTAGRACPAGFVPALNDFGPLAGDSCVRRDHPEPPRERLRAANQMRARESAPFTSVAPGAYAAAVAQRDALASASAASVSGSGGAWSRLGNPPLLAND